LASLAAADVIVLASGSAAEALVAVQRPASDTAIVAIGPSTAEVARRVGLRPSVSATPADDDVVAAVARSVR
jgi:uroporphyrinogen-III synthase